ncbi:sensor histidine kinase [Microbacterium sp. NPDC091313]
MAWLSEGERRPGVVDSTRDRTAMVNQIFLSGVSLVATLAALALGQVHDATTFAIGLTIVYVASAAAVLVPWKRVPAVAVAILPVADIIAIGFLREATPLAGFGLLWTFPAMWIAAIFGIPGVIVAVIGITTILGTITALDPTQSLSASTFVLPVTIAALGTIAALAARRNSAQRELLDKQARQLQHSVARARRQEDLVTEALDSVEFGVIRITPEGELVVTNEAHARLQGSAEQGGQKMPMFARDGETPLEPDAAPLARARRGEEFSRELVWYGAPDAPRRALSVSARPLTEIDGSPAGVIVVSQDVTSEIQALRAREDLVASVSHELRTPLTSILGYLELTLDREDLPPDLRQNLGVAERNAERLLELVTDILDISSVSRHGVELVLHRSSTDLAALVVAAAESLGPRAAERGIVITLDEVQPVTAAVDPHRIRQVIDNLLSNAVKYHRDGGGIWVGLSGDDVHAWLTVSDDGPGIPEHEQPHLFERFFRADAVRNSSTHGSGLGLAISRELVRAHGGDIFVQSRPGAGATFTVRLPLTPDDTDAAS